MGSFPSGKLDRFDDFSLLDSAMQSLDVRAREIEGLPASISRAIDVQLERVEFDLQKVNLLALAIADPFWDEVVERRESGDKTSDIGVRVRRKGHASEISYYRSSFHVSQKGRRYLKSVFIRKSAEHEYRAKDLTGLYSWEKELILEFEESFKHCRKLSKSLVAARKSLREAKDALAGVM